MLTCGSDPNLHNELMLNNLNGRARPWLGQLREFALLANSSAPTRAPITLLENPCSQPRVVSGNPGDISPPYHIIRRLPASLQRGAGHHRPLSLPPKEGSNLQNPSSSRPFLPGGVDVNRTRNWNARSVTMTIANARPCRRICTCMARAHA